MSTSATSSRQWLPPCSGSPPYHSPSHWPLPFLHAWSAPPPVLSAKPPPSHTPSGCLECSPQPLSYHHHLLHLPSCLSLASCHSHLIAWSHCSTWVDSDDCATMGWIYYYYPSLSHFWTSSILRELLMGGDSFFGREVDRHCHHCCAYCLREYSRMN